jgi:hypothetical protein
MMIGAVGGPVLRYSDRALVAAPFGTARRPLNVHFAITFRQKITRLPARDRSGFKLRRALSDERRVVHAVRLATKRER